MTSPFNDDNSLCFGFNVGYCALLGIGNTGVTNLWYAYHWWYAKVFQVVRE